MLTGLDNLATRTKTRLDMLPLMKLHSLNAHKYMLAMSLQKLLATKTVECYIAYKVIVDRFLHLLELMKC